MKNLPKSDHVSPLFKDIVLFCIACRMNSKQLSEHLRLFTILSTICLI